MSGPGEAWAKDCDLSNRDPNNINDHLGIAFEDVIGEPDHTHAMDCVWKFSYKCFNMWKTLCYCIATLFCGIPAASCWGCYFACVAFEHIWNITPCFKAVAINCGIMRKCLRMYTETFCDPCFESCGKCFIMFKKS